MRTSAAIAVTLASASLVLAQNSTFSPAGLNASPGCSTFLSNLNSNSIVKSCLDSLVDATKDFDPSANGGNSSAIDSALNTMCSPSFASRCDQSHIRSSLSEFYAACGSDMVGADGGQGNKQVIELYDTLYLIIPLKNAVCAKDDTGKYCVNQISSTAAPEGQNNTDQTPLTPDLDSYRETGLPYLFLTPDTDPAQLCSSCAGNILGAYVSFETVTPYALGIANSIVLNGQPELWSKVEQCQNGLANAILANNTGASSSGATDVRVGMTGVVVALMSAVVATFALF